MPNILPLPWWYDIVSFLNESLLFQTEWFANR